MERKKSEFRRWCEELGPPEGRILVVRRAAAVRTGKQNVSGARVSLFCVLKDFV